MRGGDAIALTCDEVHFDRREIERMTQKRRNPTPTDHVLPNPLAGKPLSRPRLYERILALGCHAGVANARPHRFRDGLAVDVLTRGASPYSVAKMLGDTIETVGKHYMPLVGAFRECVRRVLESDGGLEEFTVTPGSQSPARIQ